MMRIAVKPPERGNCSMKSIDIEFQECSGAGRGFRKLPWGLTVLMDDTRDAV